MSHQHIFDTLATSPFTSILPCVGQLYGQAGELHVRSQPFVLDGVGVRSTHRCSSVLTHGLLLVLPWFPCVPDGDTAHASQCHNSRPR
eukprot:6211272-Pleurochrysis_carterae.AAC.3